MMTEEFAMPRRSRLLLALATAFACFAASVTQAEPITLWPSVPFVRGQDLCQFTDAYGLGKRQQTGAMIGHLERLLTAGIDPEQAVDALRSIDQIIERDRSEARRGDGIDTLLEGSFKASLEEIYARAAPETRMLEFFNPAALDQALADVRNKRGDRKSSLFSLQKVDAFAWGTYSYAPSCSANLYVTLHVQESCGRISSFQAIGRPERVMGEIAAKVFGSYQATHFPTQLTLKSGKVTLVSPAGQWVAEAATVEQAAKACEAMGARLPTADEYELMDVRGDWNGGVCTQGRYWALAESRILAPELTNPSPIRRETEISTDRLFFYCVRED
jgi:hypothetical protein